MAAAHSRCVLPTSGRRCLSATSHQVVIAYKLINSSCRDNIVWPLSLKACPHWRLQSPISATSRRKRRLSTPLSATVTVFGDSVDRALGCLAISSSVPSQNRNCDSCRQSRLTSAASCVAQLVYASWKLELEGSSSLVLSVEHSDCGEYRNFLVPC